MNAIISNAIVRTLDVKGASYFARPAGSSVDGLDVSDGNAVADFLLAHNWEEVTEEAGNIGARFGACRYFRANINEGYSGQEGITSSVTCPMRNSVMSASSRVTTAASSCSWPDRPADPRRLCTSFSVTVGTSRRVRSTRTPQQL